MISLETLKEWLDYDPTTGIFTWKVWRGGKAVPGSIAGVSNTTDGYVYIGLEGRRHGAHRLAWWYMTGEFPTDQIDHINLVRGDNRFCNLRPATNAENKQNGRKHKDNTSGYVGVWWHKQRQKWSAQIMVRGVKFSLGLYETAEKAHEAYCRAKVELHDFQPTTQN